MVADMTADSFGFSVGLFDFSDIECSIVWVMKTDRTWKHIGTIAARIACRLKARREEIRPSKLGEASAGSGIVPGVTPRCDDADHDAGENARGFTELKFVATSPRGGRESAGSLLWE